MSRNDQKRSKKRRKILRLWSHAEAMAALPYISSIVRSLREDRLEAVQLHQTAQRLADKPGRPNRHEIVAHQETVAAAAQADQRFEDDLEELQTLDIYCLDPLRGEVVIPFAYENQLSWYVYDLFDEHPLQYWRFHSDPFETRRPLAEMQTTDHNVIV
jgi:hypothetical protein